MEHNNDMYQAVHGVFHEVEKFIAEGSANNEAKQQRVFAAIDCLLNEFGKDQPKEIKTSVQDIIDQYAFTQDGKSCCTICRKRFTSNYGVAEHVKKVHFNPKPKFVQCKVCNAEFPTKIIKQHVAKIHINSYPLIYTVACTACMDRFETDEKLDDHVKNVHSFVIK